MEKNFPRDHIVDIDSDISYCVFRVPKTLTEEKPEAYTPHHLGLGPYHHLRPDLYIMHNQKLAAIRKFLSPEKLQNFQRLVDGLVQSEPIIRACYDHYLDLDIHTLAWILAIDGLYLLHFFKNYPQMETLAADVFMLENQIPFILLDKIRLILELPPDDAGDKEILVFLHDQSPLELNEFDIAENLSVVSHSHLLHCMYRMIMTKSRPIFTPYSLQLNDVIQGVQFLADQGLPGAGTAGQVLSFVTKIPWDKIFGLFKKGGGDEQTPSTQEIDIPSVSRMSEAAGIKFVATDGGIRDIRFEDSEDERRFCLPLIRLTATSEVVLRNLVAYEEASAEPGSAALVLAEYVDLMCGIIDSAKDVGILKKGKIIETELADGDVARIFNGISKSRKKKDDKSNVEEAIDNVNARYNSLVSVKVKRFLTKYGGALLKFVGAVITIVVVVLLILQAFCSVFGCGRWFGKSTMQIPRPLFSYQ